jgi:hypothetical protein
MRDYINTAKELQKMLLMLHTRSRAATTIQSTWRGWAQRRRWMPVWEAHLEQKQRLQAAVVLQQVGEMLCCPMSLAGSLQIDAGITIILVKAAVVMLQAICNSWTWAR